MEADAVYDAEREQVYEEMIALGVDEAVAAQLVQRHPPERLRAWCEKLRRERTHYMKVITRT